MRYESIAYYMVDRLHTECNSDNLAEKLVFCHLKYGAEMDISDEHIRGLCLMSY